MFLQAHRSLLFWIFFTFSAKSENEMFHYMETDSYYYQTVKLSKFCVTLIQIKNEEQHIISHFQHIFFFYDFAASLETK